MAGGRKTTKISSTSTQAEKYEVLMQPFRDPDDAENLLEQVIVSDNERDEGWSSDSSSWEESEDPGAEDDEGGNTRFSALRFKQDYSNQRNIFLACMFLSGRLPDLMFPEDESGEKFSVARESKGFKALAKELGRQEPTLRKVTGVALWSMYSRLLKAYDKLDKVLQVETGGRFEHSRLSELVKTIFDLEKDYAAKRKHISVEKEQERQRALTEQESINAEAVRDSMLTLGARQAILRKEREEADASSAVTPSRSITATSVITLPRPTTTLLPTNTTSVAMSSGSPTESASKSLSDMQHQLLIAVRASNNKYDSMVSRQDAFEAQFTTQFADFLDMFKRLEQMVKGMKSTLSDLKDDVDEMRREVRGVKRKNDSLESIIEDIQRDVQEIKRRKQ